MKAFFIIALAVAAIVGGLLTLRSSGRSGMPGEDVLKRASKRAREMDAADDRENGRPHG
jgi:hypothetical protein